MKTGITADGTIVVYYEEKVEYYSRLIRILEIVNPSKRTDLSNTEVKFLALCLSLDEEGINIKSTKCRKILEEELDLTTQSIYNMRSKLKSLGWIRENDLGYSFASILTKKDLSFRILNVSEDEY